MACKICELASGYTLLEHFNTEYCKSAGARLVNIGMLTQEEADKKISEHDDKYVKGYFSFEPTIK